MAKKEFQYGGYTFEPRGQFKDHGIKSGKNEFQQISNALYFPNRGNVADGDEKFVYDEFYKASGGSDDDVFLCKENGILYVPCARALAIFDQETPIGEVLKHYDLRREKRDEHERLVKRSALKESMHLTDEQYQALKELTRAAKKCQSVGLQFSSDKEYVFVFRADLLEDLTEDMAPMEGQSQIPAECFHAAIYGVWDSHEGLYANPKPHADKSQTTQA